jgi:16S rRNA (cytosine1402-N4)-methyltransferase
MQIDIPERGFSFRGDGPLDMRMDNINLETAAQLIERIDVTELANILRDYGDVSKAVPLARAIKNTKPKTTFELKDLIHNSKDVAPVFQALRIAVNDEMGEIKRALSVVPDLLVVGGKCICVTFHSIEDRVVKNTFRQWTTVPGDPRLPVVADAPFDAIKTALPDKNELEYNSRARSAHMRGVIKSY